MMKSIKMLLMSAVLLSLSATGSAQTMEQWWLNMPDTLFSYINKSKRIEAMDYRNMGLKLDVTNLLKGSTLVDTLTNNYIEVKLNEAALLQMRLLPKDSDTVVCVVSTFYGPEAESQICYYDRTWRRVGEEQTDSLIDAYVAPHLVARLDPAIGYAPIIEGGFTDKDLKVVILPPMSIRLDTNRECNLATTVLLCQCPPVVYIEVSPRSFRVNLAALTARGNNIHTVEILINHVKVQWGNIRRNRHTDIVGIDFRQGIQLSDILRR